MGMQSYRLQLFHVKLIEPANKSYANFQDRFNTELPATTIPHFQRGGFATDNTQQTALQEASKFLVAMAWKRFNFCRPLSRKFEVVCMDNLIEQSLVGRVGTHPNGKTKPIHSCTRR